jgi:hypothetical protein
VSSEQNHDSPLVAGDEMVALPAFKFVFLAIRQVTRPVAKQIVQRANTKHALTYRMCIGLGRFSLGLSGVIAEWTRAEEQKQREAKKKSEETQKMKLAQAAEAEVEKAAGIAKKAAEAVMHAVVKRGNVSTPSTSTPADTASASASTTTVVQPEVDAGVPSSTTPTPAPTPSAPPQPPAAPASAEKETSSLSTVVQPAPVTLATVIPRSRSLLQSVVYGPQLKDSPTDTYDSTVFLDPKRTVGEAARVFIRYPARSSWDVFRQTFLAPFPEDRLVAAGADLMIELVAYTVLCTLLVVELMQQSRTTAAKEAHVNARLEAIEAKVNELVEHNNESRAYPTLEELPPVPELQVTGRLGALWGAVTSSASFVGSAFTGGTDDGTAIATVTSAAEERERLAQSGKAVVPLREAGANLARAPPRDPAVKVSKYDESEVFQVELDKLLRSVKPEKRA